MTRETRSCWRVISVHQVAGSNQAQIGGTALSKLKISDSLWLPIDAVTQKFGILGRTGSGKSYAATKVAEEMLEAKAQIVVLDPVGVWYGLRIDKNGRDEGFPIPILGGLHGDIPLEPGAGALIADLIVDREISAVIDVSGFLLNEQRRFATDFAMQLFHRKKAHRSALHLFVEEAQEFVPQHVRGDVARMVGAYERLLKLGRNFGIGATLISQRPQSVNKDVLNQTECLLAFQMTGPQERKAVAAWIAEKGLDADIVNELPKLKVGECYIWSPQWLQISKQITVAEKTTADVSSTPKPGVKTVELKQLSQIELEHLSDKMLATIERAKAEDPKELRRRLSVSNQKIAELEREPQKRPEGGPASKVEIKEVPVLKDGQIDRLQKLQTQFEQLFERCGKQLEFFSNDALTKLNALFAKRMEVYEPINAAVAKVRAAGGSASPKTMPVRAEGQSHRNALMTTHSTRRLPQAPLQRSSDNGDISLGIGERRCAIAIAQHPNGVTREQLTTLTGYKRSTRNTYLQRLLAATLIDETSGRFLVNDAGVAWLGNDYELLPTGSQLQDYWIRKLPEGESKVFQVVLGRPSEGISREQIGELTGYKRSTRNTYLQRLAARELVTISGEMIWPSETLFEEAAA
jgi:uncharacterized protein